MPSEIGYSNNQVAHSNYGFAVYNDMVIGKLEDLTMIVSKDAEYDVIIGSGGKPFGLPIVKFTKFTGSFSKGMFNVSDLDKLITLHSVGNSYADFSSEDKDKSNFSSDDRSGFIDNEYQSLTFFPVATPHFAIAFGGIIITNYKLEIINSKFARIRAEFKGKFIEYYNKLKITDLKTV